MTGCIGPPRTIYVCLWSIHQTELNWAKEITTDTAALFIALAEDERIHYDNVTGLNPYCMPWLGLVFIPAIHTGVILTNGSLAAALVECSFITSGKGGGENNAHVMAYQYPLSRKGGTPILEGGRELPRDLPFFDIFRSHCVQIDLITQSFLQKKSGCLYHI